MADSRIDELRRRLERDPGSRLFAQLAEEHRKAGQHAEAIRVARAGLALHPAYPSARLTLGRALLDSGDAAGARAELEAALRDAPDNILASRFLGQALEALGELAPALHQLEKTLKMAPGDGQLEGQIAALRTRLRSSATALPATLPPRVLAPPPLPEAEADVPATIPILRSRERGAAGATASPPPSPPPAAPAPPPEPPASRLPPPAVEKEPDAAEEAEALPPTLRPGALSVEETVFEAEGGPEGGGEVVVPGAGARPWAEDGGGEETAPFSSSTLAELYFRQGLAERAVEVYQQVLVDEPGNDRARARLDEIASALPADSRLARRRALERTIAGLEALLAAVGRVRA